MTSNKTLVDSPSKIEALSAASSVNMADQWYEHATPDHFWMQWRLKVLLEVISKYKLGDQLLEIGCGSCVARDQLEKELSLPIDACDLNLHSLQLAGPARGHLYVYDIFDQRPEWKDHFSTVFLLDTLEHIEQPSAFLNAIRFHMQLGGHLVINVPALQPLYSAYDSIAGHVKRYTKSLLASELKLGGFELVESRYWGLSMIPVLSLRKLMGKVWSRDKVIANGFKPSTATDAILRGLMKIERAVTRNPVYGTSLTAVARKVEN